MARARLALGLSLACLPALGGCLFVHHSAKVIRENEPRRPAAFETELAQRVFEDEAQNDGSRTQAGSGGLVAIPFLLWWSSSKVKSPEAWYNDCFAKCDRNHDLLISEAEALAFNPDFARDTAAASVEVEPEPAVKTAGHQEPEPRRNPPASSPRTKTRVR